MSKKAYCNNLERLSQARPSDEMMKLNIMNMEFESLLNGLTSQRKKTLKHLGLMEGLIDFDSLAKNPAKKKVTTQTTGASNSSLITFGLSESKAGKRMLPFIKYF